MFGYTVFVHHIHTKLLFLFFTETLPVRSKNLRIHEIVYKQIRTAKIKDWNGFYP